MSDYQYVLDQLSRTKGRWPSIAQATGVPYRTLEKIGRQESKNPGVNHIEKLAGYFRSIVAKRPSQRISA
jgi:hypothetical protein